MTLHIKLDRVIWHNDVTGWGVYSCWNTNSRTKCTVVGMLMNPVDGMECEAKGEWVTDAKYGRQFKAASITAAVPTTTRGIMALLCSKRVPGIGAVTAEKIVMRFGRDALDIIRSDKDYLRLTEVPGVSARMAEALHKVLPEHDVYEDLRMLLGSDATEGFLNRIIEKYSDSAVSVIQNNPYRLIEDFSGVGFIKADKIAKALGIADNAPVRIRAAIYHLLSIAADTDGHCYSYCSNLEAGVEELIPGVAVSDIADVIKDMTTDRSYKKMALVVDDDGAIYLASLYHAETTVAQQIRRLLSPSAKAALTPYDTAVLEAAAERVEVDTGILPEAGQMAAVQTALSNGISVITGGPGTGKTTIIRTILQAIQIQEPHCEVALLAPTGRAAVRMRMVTNHETATIHAALSLYASDDERELSDVKLNYDTIIVDEASMIDIRLASMLMNALGEARRIVFVGDIDQLPSVGPGVFFRSLVESYKVPRAKLTLSFRQSGTIASNAAKVNLGTGCHGLAQDETFQITPIANKTSAASQAVEAYMEMVKKYGPNEAVLLAPTRKRGDCCTNVLNQRIQAIVNPADGRPELPYADGVFRVGDRVMLQKNMWKHGIANGDTGVIQEIDATHVLVFFDTGLVVPFEVGTFKATFNLAYACTVHKVQGSEYRGIVFVFASEHIYMGQRNIVYTALTRAKDEVQLVCNARALNIAIGKVTPLTRNSKLKERINA